MNRDRCDKCLTQRFWFDGQHEIHLGPLKIMRHRRSCGLCRLVHDRLGRSQVDPDALVVLKPASDDRRKYSISCRDAQSDTVEGWIRFPTASSPLSRAAVHGMLDLQLMKRWLQECQHSHLDACNDTRGDEGLKEFMLIDVKVGNLVKAELQWDFVALSYVNGGWGGDTFSLDNITTEDLQTPGVLFSNRVPLPAVIRDAIDLVRNLGYHYLWSDFLCILRGSHAQKQIQIQQMDAIYGKAFLTMVALSGKHGNVGLPGLHAGSRGAIFASVDLNQEENAVVFGPDLHTIRSRTEYRRRGWTLQEEILSSRCLYLADSQAYFRCQVGYCREDGEAVQSLPLSVAKFGHPGLQRYVDPNVQLLHSDVETLLSLYANLLQDYSMRELSFDSDILNAFNGIMNILAKRFHTEFICGIPQNAMPQALLWIPVEGIRKRFQGKFRSSEGESWPSSSSPPPTWSWAAWRGEIHLPQSVRDSFATIPSFLALTRQRQDGNPESQNLPQLWMKRDAYSSSEHPAHDPLDSMGATQQFRLPSRATEHNQEIALPGWWHESVLCFFCNTFPFSWFLVRSLWSTNGALSSSTVSTGGGRCSVNLETLAFSGGRRNVDTRQLYGERMFEASSTEIEQSVSAVFKYNMSLTRGRIEEVYFGILYGYGHYYASLGTSVLSGCILLLISRSAASNEAGTQTSAIWNMLLVKPVGGGSYERVAVGRFREDLMMDVPCKENQYIKLV